MDVYPVILCGGPGARLWPASTSVRPKPFLDLLDGPSLFQRTLTRMAALTSCPPVVVTGIAHLDVARAQAEDVGASAVFLVEPEGRDSAPAIVAAAQWVAREDPRALIVAVASDHHIPDVAAFVASIEQAGGAAVGGAIVTFGVKPRYPATGFGYIRPGAALDSDSAVRRVDAFLEKPQAAVAEVLVSSGCLWNSSNLLFRADILLAEVERYCPGLAEAVAESIAGAVIDGGAVCLGLPFVAAQRISIDFGVLERTTCAAVLPIDYDWSDLGSWDAVWRAASRDSESNAIIGNAAAPDSRGCLVRAEGGVSVVALGVRDLAVIAGPEAVLVCDLGEASKVRGAADLVARAGRGATAGTLEPRAAVAQAADRLVDWLSGAALPLWWCHGADHDDGGFHERLRWDRTPTAHPRRARVQARQVFVYATAGALGWPGPWRAAVRHGLDFLHSRFLRRDGLYRASVAADGAPMDGGALLYDQAFVLLAMATAAAAQPELAPRLEAKATALVEAIEARFAHLHGGYHASEHAPEFLADPLMHLFEAALAWSEVSAHERWSALARGIAVHGLDRIVDATGDRIREVFDADWRPAPGPEGRVLEPGHQFEWAWLFERWGRRTKHERARRVAAALYATGRRGINPASGVVVDEMTDDFRLERGSARLWPQTEWMKATLLIERDPIVRLNAIVSSARAMQAYLTSEPPGLWRDSQPGPGAPVEDSAPASSFYHLAGAIAALDRERQALDGLGLAALRA